MSAGDRDGEQRGVGKALGHAYPPIPLPDPAMTEALARLDRKYRPDAVADARFDQLLERVRRLPWADDPTD